MINLKVLSTAAAMAVVLPMVAPSTARSRRRIERGGGGGGGVRAGGGGGGGAAIAAVALEPVAAVPLHRAGWRLEVPAWPCTRDDGGFSTARRWITRR